MHQALHMRSHIPLTASNIAILQDTCLVISASVVHFLEFFPREALVAIRICLPDDTVYVCLCQNMSCVLTLVGTSRC